jgi:hypothetical protein
MWQTPLVEQDIQAWIVVQICKQGIEQWDKTPVLAVVVRPLQPLQSVIDLTTVGIDLGQLVGRPCRADILIEFHAFRF